MGEMFRPELLKLEYCFKAAVRLGLIFTYIDNFIIIVMIPFRTKMQQTMWVTLTKF